MTSPLRVAVLVPDVDALGGMERQALSLSHALTRAGDRVTLLTTAPTPRTELRDGLRLHHLPLPLLEPLAPLLLHDVQVIYAVQLMCAAIGARVARVLDVPCAIKFSGAGATGDMVALDALPPRTRQRVTDDLRGCARIAISQAIADEAAARHLRAPHRIPNGVDLSRFALPHQLPPHQLPPHPRLVYLGRLDLHKGLDTLLDAWPRVLAHLPDATLDLLGDGPDRNQLTRRAGRNVRFLGRRDDVPAQLSRAHALVLPSRAEGLSNALLEALAAGVPAVASAIAPNREVLAEGGGVLVAPDDPAALAEALTSVLGDPQRRASLAEEGRRAARRYGLDEVAARHRALFRGLIEEGARRTSPGGGLARYARARVADLWRRARP